MVDRKKKLVGYYDTWDMLQKRIHTPSDINGVMYDWTCHSPPPPSKSKKSPQKDSKNSKNSKNPQITKKTQQTTNTKVSKNQVRHTSKQKDKPDLVAILGQLVELLRR
jgi:hypothetical protein